jgi:uncharacterized protein YceK
VKKLFCLLLISVMLVGCGNPMHLTVDGKGKMYPTYGLFNEAEDRSNKVCYQLSVGNVVWSIILVETIIAPIYFVGWSLWEPVNVKDPTTNCEVQNNIDNR